MEPQVLPAKPAPRPPLSLWRVVVAILVGVALAIGVAQVCLFLDRVHRTERRVDMLEDRLGACEGPGGVLWRDGAP